MILCLRGWDIQGKGKRVTIVCPPMSSKDPTPKKILNAKSDTRSDRSWQGVKTFFGVGSPNIKGSNPEESFKREISTYVRHVLALYVESKLSSGLDP